MNYTDMQPGDLVVFDFDLVPEYVYDEWKLDCAVAEQYANGVFCLDSSCGVSLGGVWYTVRNFRPAPIQPGMSVRLAEADDIDEPWETEISRLFRHEDPVVVLAVKDSISVAFKEGGLLFDVTRFRTVAPGTKVRHALPGAAPAEALSANVQRGTVSATAPDPSALRDAEAIARQDAPAAPAPGPVEFTDPVTGQRLLRYPPEVMRTHAGDEWVWVHTRGVR